MSKDALRLTIATPSRVWFDAVEIVSLRAEDASGSFGIRIGHADFVTQLTSSVVRWTGTDNVLRYCAVNGGVLLVSGGATVSIACREAIPGDSLEGLEAIVRSRHADEDEAARRARVDQMRLHARAVRQMLRYLRPRAGADGANPAGTGATL
ncbi:ATP synthase, Delta/Epsilon chain, beta-sandwich domain protein [Paraburkholderia xenovorans LB400]|uniref:ATP synthase epsilon chain n=1 Tax=Paraburkholderia xenovorans (strain LB400) TaxID=266265 RepID=Q13XV4_PARXL|nr:F0F1 ATP synthase subunit epsilon [Paraburkholderia xenovorans]ABE31085.1 Putative (H+)-transporting two-sector ATPase, delta/epsilon subunit protein [Paraburkholderia xenovorans LB400]AIP29931.1 ATP synthase, Delta/Epsilon chain, beta-sandwich domain protein [Paraburkholderia xenovorans LB400]NPT36892.1 F0F1 ATP synthase subunit epsilon [Paraburkholderia xenovorans]